MNECRFGEMTETGKTTVLGENLVHHKSKGGLTLNLGLHREGLLT
jgi:hypothetical protein